MGLHSWTAGYVQILGAANSAEKELLRDLIFRAKTEKLDREISREVVWYILHEE